MQPVLEVEDLELRRQDGWSAALPALRLLPGEAAALLGPSGSGKSSLLLALFGLEPPAFARRGRVALLGREFAALDAAERRRLLRRSVAFVLQDAQAALDPLLPIGAQLRQSTGSSAGECAAALGALGVDDPAGLLRRLPHQISGGQAQRVLLAVAVLRRPALVVADEPSASLDDGNLDELLARLAALRGRGSALLLSSHDPRLRPRIADARWLVAQDGVFRAGAPSRGAFPARAPRAPSAAPVVLAARGVRLVRGGRPLLDGVDLELRSAEILALVGPSGAGKTTLARVLAGHLQADAGTVVRPPRPTAVQLLFQDAFASLTPGRTLGSLLAEAQAPGFGVAAAAAQLALPAAALGRTAGALSGGERRRAALLRALAVAPEVLILDEPTASLDHAAASGVVTLLASLREQQGVAVLLITHDLELAHAVADRVVALEGGRTCT